LVCFRCTQIRDGHYPESRKGDISRHLMANTVCPFCLDDIDQDIDQDIDMRGSARANVSRMSDKCHHLSHATCFRQCRDRAKTVNELRCALCCNLSNWATQFQSVGIVYNSSVEWQFIQEIAHSFDMFDRTTLGDAYQRQSKEFGQDSSEMSETKFLDTYLKRKDIMETYTLRSQLHLMYFKKILDHGSTYLEDGKLSVRCFTCHSLPINMCMTCSVCKTARYCSVACQWSDWPNHMLACSPFCADLNVPEIWSAYCSLLLRAPIFTPDVISRVSAHWSRYAFRLGEDGTMNA
jgi:hypothetical protein